MTETSAAEPGDALLAGAPDRFNPDELLQRYARGRVRHFGQRQLLTGLGGITLWIVDGPLIGLLAIAMRRYYALMPPSFKHVIRDLNGGQS